MPAYTWDGTATAVLYAGGVPVFADVDPDTYCLAPEAARARHHAAHAAVMPVHLAMRFADMDAPAGARPPAPAEGHRRLRPRPRRPASRGAAPGVPGTPAASASRRAS